VAIKKKPTPTMITADNLRDLLWAMEALNERWRTRKLGLPYRIGQWLRKITRY